MGLCTSEMALTQFPGKGLGDGRQVAGKCFRFLVNAFFNLHVHFS
jgi:hypothetical protein